MYKPYMQVFSYLETFPNPIANLISLGIESRDTEYYYDNNFRNIDAYLFQYTLEGEGILELDGVTHSLPKNTGFFLKIPGDSRYYLPKGTDKNWTFLFILVEASQMKEYYNRTISENGTIFTLDSDSELIQWLLDKTEQAKAGFITDFTTASSIAYEFMNRIYFTFSASHPRYSNRIQRVINEMRNHFSTLDGSREVAEFFGISENHFIREFKSEVGITPTKYLNNLRLAHAKKLLRSSNMSVDEISETCGYARANYFCKIFKEHCGMTPLTYRNAKNTT